eukprot:163259_1
MSQAAENTSNKQEASPLCAGACGFYGNKNTRNCCSVCFKKMYPEEWLQLQQKSKPSNNDKSKDNEKKDESVDKNDKKNDDNKPKRKVQKKKNRCWNCRKKVTLAGQFGCKCGYVFCSMHRYPDAHECDFDWKKQHQANLSKNNKVVAPAKLEKI